MSLLQPILLGLILGSATMSAVADAPVDAPDAPGSFDSATLPGSGDEGEGWRLRLTPYLWIPAQDGDVAIRGVDARVDLNVGDTFDAVTDNFNFAISLHAELQRGALSLFGDLMYTSLKADDVPIQSTTGTVRQDTGVFEFGLACRLLYIPKASGSIGLVLEPLAGLRAHYLSLEVSPRGAASASSDEFWVDAIVGARSTIRLHDAVNIRLRGDLGAGGSDFTWSALAGLQIEVGPRFALELGYRALGTDYSTGSGDERFTYDMLLHGPYLGFALTF